MTLSGDQEGSDALIIDFASAAALGGLGFENQIRLGSITLARCIFRASEGVSAHRG
jgi:hypothetical protein